MNRSRFFARLPLFLTVLGVISAAATYIFGMSWLQSKGSTLFGPDELWIPRGIDVLITLWLFWIGSSIGSFLNVVAWRMPRGVSINGRSHCPRCETHLKARDNFPVLGWMALAGRCRTCRLPISKRYPIVEAVVGFCLTLVGIAELYRLSIPGQYVHWHGGPFWTPTIDRQVIAILVFHAVAVAVSWAFGLIRYDRERLPWRLVAFAFAATSLSMLAYPTFMIVPWQTVRPNSWIPDGLHADALMRIITASVAAGVFGRSLARGLCPTADPKLDPLGRGTARLIDLVTIIAIPSIVVGWQTIPAVIVLASLISLALRRILPAKCDMLGCFALSMPIALTIQLVLWRRLHASPYWPSDITSHWVIMLAAGIVLIIPAWLREAPAAPVLVDVPFCDDNDDDDDDDGQSNDEEQHAPRQDNV